MQRPAAAGAPHARFAPQAVRRPTRSVGLAVARSRLHARIVRTLRRLAEPRFQLRDASAQPLNLLPQRPDQRILLCRRQCRQVRKPGHLQLESRPDSVVDYIARQRCRRPLHSAAVFRGLRSNYAFGIP